VFLPPDIQAECKKFLKLDDTVRVIFQTNLIKILGDLLCEECFASNSADDVMRVLLDLAQLDIESDRSEERLRGILKFMKRAVSDFERVGQYVEKIFLLLHAILCHDIQLSKELRKKAVKLVDLIFGSLTNIDQKYYVLFVKDFSDKYTTELSHLRQDMWGFLEKVLADNNIQPGTISEITPFVLKVMRIEEFEKVNDDTRILVSYLLIGFDLILCQYKHLLPETKQEAHNLLHSWVQPNGYLHKLYDLEILHVNRNELEGFIDRVLAYGDTTKIWNQVSEQPHIVQMTNLIPRRSQPTAEFPL